MTIENSNIDWFVNARFGMFIHFGLFSMLTRGEWVMNKERIAPEEYRKLADEFNPVNFDADSLCSLAKEAGMKYIVFTTMHHEGFRLYDTALTDFCSTKTLANRDFVAEVIDAARKHGLKIGLYHSLNNWYDKPDAVEALENKVKYQEFINNTFARIRELLMKYNPVDILWYDGWWPFNAQEWKAEEMNKMARSIQPHLIINGRNGLPGDFSTPEGHMSQPSPWRPWEACMTLNDSWGYHKGDHNWKSVKDVIQMLGTAANGNGNLLLNIAPKGDGSIPGTSLKILKRLTHWMKINGEAIFNTDIFCC
ncbi:MAG: alpha-L-fucosidase, partial [Victivallaceae bacterium]|nr:alpha-L-fucosidase [Victivallaceae bacterium]